MTLGFRAKIVLIVGLSVLVGLGSVVATSSHRFSEAYLAALESRSAAIAHGLRIQMDRILHLGIRIDQLVGFDTQCRRVVESFEGIDFAAITDPEGKVLFSSDGTATGEPIRDAKLLTAVLRKAETRARYGEGATGGYGSVVPILGPDQVHVGSVVVGLSARVLDDKMTQIRFDVIGVGLALLAIGAIVLIGATTHFIARPLQALIRSVDQVRSDTTDFSRRIDIRSGDELGALAQAFNGLMQSLQQTTVSKSSLEAAYAALQASEEKYRLLVSDARALILRLDPDGTITYFNEYAERFFGYASAEVLGRHVVGTIVPARLEVDGRDPQGMVAAILSDPEKYAIHENENVTRDGRRVYVRWANRVLLDAEQRPVGVLSIGQDITEKWAADRELERHRYHLEELVRERTAALSVAKEAAEAASRAKTAFLANMSHELRTPMNGIMGMTDLALTRSTDPTQARYLKHVLESSRHLTAMIADVLDFTRIESERLTLDRSRFRLGDVVDRMSSLYAERAAAKGLELDVVVRDPVSEMILVGDAARLGQVLGNLVDNAIKFTEHGSVRVHVAVLEESRQEVLIRFEVVDTGIGVGEDDRARLFNAFEQIDASSTRKYGGAGLGLAICRRLALLMGGDIGVDDSPREGSAFWFTARLGRVEIRDRSGVLPLIDPTLDELQDRCAGMRVLVVEDEPMNQEVTRGLLEELGLVVDVANDGWECVAKAGHGNYDLVLMDLQMPNMNGLDAARRLRQLPGCARVPIIALTANAFAEDRSRCFDSGMDDFLTKPVLPQQVHAALLKWLPPRA